MIPEALEIAFKVAATAAIGALLVESWVLHLRVAFLEALVEEVGGGGDDDPERTPEPAPVAEAPEAPMRALKVVGG